ncbi:Bet v1-like protein [Rhizoclosmatium globosum]|uniref:Bet v1-like protein n=1 Tax=Rhizoclosmatium globosum TaxID=329046 RepID=A0A1Y2BY03_9FUNG|nr:Bet v1-like protein [Rhizoclosmatium globosum]|eukprot:ORY39652.1 Bet v1-like protein [Rhizoclosmatium globosum]
MPTRGKTHRHRLAIETAVKYFKELYTDTECWKKVSTIDGIDISKKDLSRDLQSSYGASLLPTFRGDGIIENITVQEVASVLRGFGARKLWDPRFEQGKLLETLSETENLYLSSQKGNLIVRSRDFLTANVYTLENTADEAIVVSTSVVDSLAPPEGYWGNYVRAEAKALGWMLRQEGRNVAATYIVEVDVKGQIPQSLINIIQVQAPLCIKNVADAIQEHGTLPFVVLGLSQFSPSRRIIIKSEWIDPDNTNFTVKAAIPPGKSNFSIAFPVKGKYWPGASIEMKSHAGLLVQAHQVASMYLLDGVVGESTKCLVQLHFHTSEEASQNITIHVRPYAGISQRRLSSVIGVSSGEAIYEFNGVQVLDGSLSPVDSAIAFDESLFKKLGRH